MINTHFKTKLFALLIFASARLASQITPALFACDGKIYITQSGKLIGVIVMRKTNPNAERGFRVPLVPLVPILGVVVCGVLMAGLPIESWERLGVWLLLGFIIYFPYSKNHSKLNNTK
jgi:hypothetical protein